ncbi:MAG: hypothetical protein EOP39_08580 [Rubrivivax sp.]|nr:MAG: hypothetical protein EOP39_08580 [Rubrivivax sp.]
MHFFLWLAIGALMGGLAGWLKAQYGRPRHWAVDVVFATLGAVLGGAMALALDASPSHWATLAAALLGAAALLVVAGMRLRRMARP